MDGRQSRRVSRSRKIEAAALGVEKLHTAGVPGRLFDTVHMNSATGGGDCCQPGYGVVRRKQGRGPNGIPDTELPLVYQDRLNAASTSHES